MSEKTVVMNQTARAVRKQRKDSLTATSNYLGGNTN